MAFYIKVTKKVSDKIGVNTADRNKTADGNIILWQADLNPINGDTIFDRAKFIGGAVLTASEAKSEIDGTNVEKHEVFTPDYYEDKKIPESELTDGNEQNNLEDEYSK